MSEAYRRPPIFRDRSATIPTQSNTKSSPSNSDKSAENNLLSVVQRGRMLMRQKTQNSTSIGRAQLDPIPPAVNLARKSSDASSCTDGIQLAQSFLSTPRRPSRRPILPPSLQTKLSSQRGDASLIKSPEAALLGVKSSPNLPINVGSIQVTEFARPPVIARGLPVESMSVPEIRPPPTKLVTRQDTIRVQRRTPMQTLQMDAAFQNDTMGSLELPQVPEKSPESSINGEYCGKPTVFGSPNRSPVDRKLSPSTSQPPQSMNAGTTSPEPDNSTPRTIMIPGTASIRQADAQDESSRHGAHDRYNLLEATRARLGNLSPLAIMTGFRNVSSSKQASPTDNNFAKSADAVPTVTLTTATQSTGSSYPYTSHEERESLLFRSMPESSSPLVRLDPSAASDRPTLNPSHSQSRILSGRSTGKQGKSVSHRTDSPLQSVSDAKPDNLSNEMREMEQHYEKQLRLTKSKMTELQSQIMKAQEEWSVERKQLQCDLQTELDAKQLVSSQLEAKHNAECRQYERVNADLTSKCRELEQTLQDRECFIKSRAQKVDELSKRHEEDLRDQLDRLRSQIKLDYETFVSPQELDQIRTGHAVELQQVREELEQVRVRLDEQLHRNETLKRDLTAAQQSVEEERQKLETETAALKKVLEEQIRDWKSQVDQMTAAKDQQGKKFKQQICDLEASLAKSKEEMSALQTSLKSKKSNAFSDEEIRELVSLAERLQIENDELKRAGTGVEQASLEEFIAEITQSYEDLLAERDTLAKELGREEQLPTVAATRNRLSIMANPTQRNSVRYLSEDAELLNFIETMTSKVEKYRDEAEALTKEKKQLQEDLRTMTGKYQQVMEGTHAGDLPSADSVKSMQARLGWKGDRQDQSSSPGSPDPGSIAPSLISSRSQLTTSNSDSNMKESILRRNLEEALTREDRLQQELNGLYKEMDRLFNTMAETDQERRDLQRQLSDLKTQLNGVRDRLHDEMARHLHGSSEGNPVATPSASSMRRDFRKLIDDIRTEYSQALDHETALRTEAERVLRSLKREREMELYSRSHQACQTIDAFLI